jgi:hypothetical protein
MIALALITVFSAAAESGGPVAEPAHLRKGGAGRRLV